MGNKAPSPASSKPLEAESLCGMAPVEVPVLKFPLTPEAQTAQVVCNGTGFDSPDCLIAVQRAQQQQQQSKATPTMNRNASYETPQEWGPAVHVMNLDRQRRGAPPLAWDATLANAAAKTSAGNQEARTLQHTGLVVEGTGPVGQTLFGSYSGGGNEPPPVTTNTTAVNAWLKEETSYDYAHPGFSVTTGNFTQVVWKDSTRVGCAGTYSPDASFVTCNFYPRGNIPTGFPRNVSPVK